MDGRTDEWMGGWMDKRTDVLMDGGAPLARVAKTAPHVDEQLRVDP